MNPTNHDPRRPSDDCRAHIETIERAATEAVREALRRHMLLGESVAVADDSPGADGSVRLIGPEELRRLLNAA